MHLPDLTGRSVLDVGACDGFYSFEAERRGAARVVASDYWTWTWPGSDARRNFDLAHEALSSRVEPVEVSVEELTPERVGGTFDVVLFLGVLYHAPDPLGYLRRVRSVTGDMAIIETAVDLLDIEVPAARLLPGGFVEQRRQQPLRAESPRRGGLARGGWVRTGRRLRPVGDERGVGHRPYLLTVASRHGRGELARRLRPRPRSGRMVFHAYV